MSLEFLKSLHLDITERRARLLLGIGLPVVILVLTYAPYLIVRSDLPDRLATHFGFSGNPDGSMTVNEFLLITTIMIGTGLLFCAAIAGSRHAFPVSVAPTVGFGGGFFAGLGAGIVVSTVLTQRGLGDWQEANAPWWIVLSVCGSATLVGALGAWLASFFPTTSELDVFSEDLPTMDLAAGRRAMWTGTLHNKYLSCLGVSVLLFGIVLAAGTLWWSFILTAFLGFFVLMFATLNVHVDRQGLQVKYGILPWPKTNVGIEKIATASVIDVRPVQWGGWGYRGSLKLMRRAAVVHRAGPGIRLDLNDGKVFVITVDDPETGVALLNTEIKRQISPVGEEKK